MNEMAKVQGDMVGLDWQDLFADYELPQALAADVLH